MCLSPSYTFCPLNGKYESCEGKKTSAMVIRKDSGIILFNFMFTATASYLTACISRFNSIQCQTLVMRNMSSNTRMKINPRQNHAYTAGPQYVTLV